MLFNFQLFFLANPVKFTYYSQNYSWCKNKHIAWLAFYISDCYRLEVDCSIRISRPVHISFQKKVFIRFACFSSTICNPIKHPKPKFIY